eukprot:scaffold266_cov391-Prasinococcus_capsulatus_cf.AAC.6
MERLEKTQAQLIETSHELASRNNTISMLEAEKAALDEKASAYDITSNRLAIMSKSLEACQAELATAKRGREVTNAKLSTSVRQGKKLSKELEEVHAQHEKSLLRLEHLEKSHADLMGENSTLEHRLQHTMSNLIKAQEDNALVSERWRQAREQVDAERRRNVALERQLKRCKNTLSVSVFFLQGLSKVHAELEEGGCEQIKGSPEEANSAPALHVRPGDTINNKWRCLQQVRLGHMGLTEVTRAYDSPYENKSSSVEQTYEMASPRPGAYVYQSVDAAEGPPPLGEVNGTRESPTVPLLRRLREALLSHSCKQLRKQLENTMKEHIRREQEWLQCTKECLRQVFQNCHQAYTTEKRDIQRARQAIHDMRETCSSSSGDLHSYCQWATKERPAALLTLFPCMPHVLVQAKRRHAIKRIAAWAMATVPGGLTSYELFKWNNRTQEVEQNHYAYLSDVNGRVGPPDKVFSGSRLCSRATDSLRRYQGSVPTDVRGLCRYVLAHHTSLPMNAMGRTKVNPYRRVRRSWGP